MVADDSYSSRELLKLILTRNGYDSYLLEDGEQVLMMIEKIKPDIILMDVLMPKLDGFEVCKRLKKMPNIKRIPVIFITSLDNTEDITSGFENGGVDYITQPFQPAELLARLKTHLELKNSKDRLLKTIVKLKKTKRVLINMIKRVQKAKREIKTLTGLIPICASCKNIRDDKGYWNRIETYISSRTQAQFSHGLCPDCMKKLYPKIYEKRQKELEEQAAKEKKGDPPSC